MEVILLEKIHNLGALGDKVRVKPGYGRNYLIPRKKAVPATADNIAKFEARRAELEAQQQATLAEAQTRANALAELELVIVAKAGAEGRLYGSVGTNEITEALATQGHSIEKREIRLPEGALRNVGRHTVELALHAEVSTSIVVVVAAANPGSAA
ncbi:MAG: 50S ribosomal protein L9 [Gammaproteobacteria bacterium]|jgi:large subunit ribosomal protein L9|nr:50S ribosomal protein L9 [Gammaproteobacteria bacterium]